MKPFLQFTSSCIRPGVLLELGTETVLVLWLLRYSQLAIDLKAFFPFKDHSGFYHNYVAQKGKFQWRIQTGQAFSAPATLPGPALWASLSLQREQEATS